MRTEIGSPIEPGTVITIVTTVLKIIAGLGWFSEADWPEELDEAQNILREIPGVDIARLENLRETAHTYYLKHHSFSRNILFFTRGSSKISIF